MNKSNKLTQNFERKGYKYRLLVPNSAIESKLTKCIGCCRFVWNKALALIKKDDEAHKIKVELLKSAGAKDTDISAISREFKFNPYQQLSKMLTQWKQQPDTNFLIDSYSKSLQITLEELGQAIVEAKNKTNPKKYPVFKKRGVKDSFSFNGDIKHDAINGRIFVPKIGFIPYKKSREVLGTIKNVTISKYAGNWYVSLQTERPLSQVAPADVCSDKVIGIDVGIAKAISCSDNIQFEYQNQQINSDQLNSINPLKQHQNQLAKLQKDLARKSKFSRNWYKQKAKISKKHAKIANTRKDFLHKVTTAITKSYAYVVVEALKIKNMTKSAKGNMEKHGKHVKQKSGLNKSILDQGWGTFKQFLAYKLKYNYGTELVLVNPRYTSQKCSNCGHTHADNRKNQASFQCVSCNFTMNADINASINIRTAGLAEIVCGVNGAIAQNVTLKQKPTELVTEDWSVAT